MYANNTPHLSSAELVSDLDAKVKSERAQTVEVVRLLGELDERRLFRDQGFGSLFAYCTQRLGYSEAAANRRIRTARVLRRFPRVAEYLASAELSLSTVSKAAGLLLEGDVALLEEIRGKSQRDVEDIVATRKPEAAGPRRERVRPVKVDAMGAQSPGGERASSPSLFGNASSGAEAAHGSTASLSPSKSFCNRRIETTTTSRDRAAAETLRYDLTVRVSKETMKKIERVEALLSSRFSGKVGLDRMFDVLLDDFLKRHDPRLKKPRSKAGRKRSAEKAPVTANVATGTKPRSIPAGTRRLVMERDRYSCSFVSPGGRRCASTWDLEVDHILPVARGGGDNAENLRVLCREHNQLLAERHFGKSFMRAKAAAL